jgi:OOP family OmpA-OmpF porin
MKQLNILCLFFLLGLTFGCASKESVLYTHNNNQELLGQGYRQKVDNVLFILDASSSMWEMSYGNQKYQQAKNIILGINQSISALNLRAGLHIIGDTAATRDSLSNESLIYGMTEYTPAQFARAVESVRIKGLTPLSIPLTRSIDTLKSSNGKTAVIVISDGLQVSSDNISPEAAAARLKAAYGENICIYTILIGGDIAGQKTMAEITKAGDCGFATTENALMNTIGMEEFIQTVFFEKISTPPVSFLLNVKFDLDRDIIRPDAKDNLHEIGTFLATHPQISITLEGHTCDIGSERHNSTLSLQRAESVKRYLIQQFEINPARLKTVGYGFTRPVTSNASEEGRQQNRRVMATINSR